MKFSMKLTVVAFLVATAGLEAGSAARAREALRRLYLASKMEALEASVTLGEAIEKNPRLVGAGLGAFLGYKFSDTPYTNATLARMGVDSAAGAYLLTSARYPSLFAIQLATLCLTDLFAGNMIEVVMEAREKEMEAKKVLEELNKSNRK